MALPDGIEADSLRVTVRTTHGYGSARIFEIRLY